MDTGFNGLGYLGLHYCSSAIFCMMADSFVPRHAKTCLRAHAENEDSDQPAHLLNLIRALAVRYQNHWTLDDKEAADCREWKLSAINPHDRHTWRSGVRSAMRAASQLPGRGPTDVDVAPVPAR